MHRCISDLSGLIVEVRRLIESRGADVIIGPVGETEGSSCAGWPRTTRT